MTLEVDEAMKIVDANCAGRNPTLVYGETVEPSEQ
jgi:hypothetical protein